MVIARRASARVRQSGPGCLNRDPRNQAAGFGYRRRRWRAIARVFVSVQGRSGDSQGDDGSRGRANYGRQEIELLVAKLGLNKSKLRPGRSVVEIRVAAAMAR